MYSEVEETFTLGVLLSTVSELCNERGITIKALEKDLKFGNGTIRRWDTSKPAISAVVKVACYFNVSVDYLLGMTSYKRHEGRSITVEQIGLSEQATNTLTELAQADNAISTKKIAVLNLLLEDDSIEESGNYLLQSIAEYITAPPVPQQLIQFTSEEVKVLSSAPKLSEDLLPNWEYANVLYDRILLDRVIRAVENTRSQLRHEKTTEEESNNGKPQDNN